MPCREFISLRGLSLRIELAVLESIQEDTWFALPAAIRQDPLAVEVQLALYRQSADAILVDGAGRALLQVPVLAEGLAPGPRLAALRRMADTFAQGRSELVGYVYEPVLVPRTIQLVYRVMVTASGEPASRASASGMPESGESITAGGWLAKSHLAGVLIHPLDRLALGLERR